jgi:hypothetical protein
LTLAAIIARTGGSFTTKAPRHQEKTTDFGFLGVLVPGGVNPISSGKDRAISKSGSGPLVTVVYAQV